MSDNHYVLVSGDGRKTFSPRLSGIVLMLEVLTAGAARLMHNKKSVEVSDGVEREIKTAVSLQNCTITLRMDHGENEPRIFCLIAVLQVQGKSFIWLCAYHGLRKIAIVQRVIIKSIFRSKSTRVMTTACTHLRSTETSLYSIDESLTPLLRSNPRPILQ